MRTSLLICQIVMAACLKLPRKSESSSLTEHHTSECSVNALQALRARLHKCSDAVTEEELPEARDKTQPSSVTGNQSPYSASGKSLHCLGKDEVANIRTVAAYFAGYPGLGGFYCLAKGLQHKSDWSLVVPEGEEYHLAHARLITKEFGDHVTLLEGFVPDNKTFIKQQICPRGLDLWATDFSCNAPEHLYKNVLEVCKPRFIHIENVGTYDWVPKDDTWHPFTVEMSKNAQRGVGEYGLVLNEELSFLRDVTDRKHSLFQSCPQT